MHTHSTRASRSTHHDSILAERGAHEVAHKLGWPRQQRQAYIHEHRHGLLHRIRSHLLFPEHLNICADRLRRGCRRILLFG